jgi:hypothetical protein
VKAYWFSRIKLLTNHSFAQDAWSMGVEPTCCVTVNRIRVIELETMQTLKKKSEKYPSEVEITNPIIFSSSVPFVIRW